MTKPWTEWPLVAVSLNPIKGWQPDYYGFCDLCIVRQEPGGAREVVLDCRVRAMPLKGDALRCLGEFTAAETVRFDLVGWGYQRVARDLPDVLQAVAFGCKDALPVAVNPKLCRRLLHRAVRVNEGMGHHLNKSGVFILREKSRWIDLGLWKVGTSQSFSGLRVSPAERVTEALDALPLLANTLGAHPDWSVSQLFDWQERLPPF
jgi:hypothetical protein